MAALTTSPTRRRQVLLRRSQDKLQPAPTGESIKQKQFEYDALGRLASVCDITSAPGAGTCSQLSPLTGFYTTYQYDVLGNLTRVAQNSSSTYQLRTFTYDGLSRMTSETNPENGTINYTYDSDGTCGTSYGDLVKRRDALGNVTCYGYDALHRVTSITYPTINSPTTSTPAKTFVYDVSSASGFNLSNTKGRLAEAYTGPSNNKTTDLVFSYSARGELTDVWESTPNSGGYYHSQASYWANGALASLGGLPGMPTVNYNLDSVGRILNVKENNQAFLATPSNYDPAGRAGTLTFGSLDKDDFTFDSNTGRMKTYVYTVGSTPQTVTGNLGWNANGTLGSLQITDQPNPANTQSCTYGYDDLARLLSAHCGSVWTQDFGYDPFGNISKSGSVSFQPTYNTATNRVSTVGGQSFSYDANGNTLNDTLRSYAWDAEGHATTIGSATAVYDALGRMVEQNGTTQIVYSPTGQKFALTTLNQSVQTVLKEFVPLPAGAQAVYSGTSLAYYRHPDWLGSSRLSSTPTRTPYSDLAYAPYGETYAELGGQNYGQDRSFTGQNQDTIPGGTAGLYDFLYREYGQYGRWISPDPAGFRAVSITNPQTWNRYAYVANMPMFVVDPLGLKWTLICFGYPEGGQSCYYGWVADASDLCDLGTGECDEIFPPWGHPPHDRPDRNKQAKEGKCIPRSSLPLSTRVTLGILSWTAKRSGGVRAIGLGGAGAFSPPSLAGGGGSVQALWMADSLGQQGLYWSISGGPTVGEAGAGAVGGVQYMTSTSNTNVSVQDVVNSSLTVGGGAGAGVGAAVDYSPQTGVFTGTIGLGTGGWGGASGLNIASGFIPICKE